MKLEAQRSLRSYVAAVTLAFAFRIFHPEGRYLVSIDKQHSIISIINNTIIVAVLLVVVAFEVVLTSKCLIAVVLYPGLIRYRSSITIVWNSFRKAGIILGPQSLPLQMLHLIPVENMDDFVPYSTNDDRRTCIGNLSIRVLFAAATFSGDGGGGDGGGGGGRSTSSRLFNFRIAIRRCFVSRYTVLVHFLLILPAPDYDEVIALDPNKLPIFGRQDGQFRSSC